MHRVGGDALGGMDGGGIAKTGRGSHIVTGHPDGQLGMHTAGLVGRRPGGMCAVTLKVEFQVLGSV